METRFTISNVADSLNIAKDVFAAYKALTITLGGSLTAYLASVNAASPVVVWSFVGVSVVGAGCGVYPLVIKTLQRIKRRNNDVEATFFATIMNEVTINIFSDGKKASFSQTRLVKCLKDGIRFYKYQFFPAQKFSKVAHNEGTVTVLDTADTTEVAVEFKKPLRTNDQMLLKLSAIMTDVFPASDETWCFSKFYHGTEAYTLQIFYPPKKFPKNYRAEIIEGGHRIPLNDELKEHFNRRKPSLALHVPALKDGQDLYLYFKW